MTLNEWVAKSGYQPTTPTTELGAVSITISQNSPHAQELYHVSDYKVDSFYWSVAWLVPKNRVMAKSLKPGQQFRIEGSGLKVAVDVESLKATGVNVHDNLGAVFYVDIETGILTWAFADELVRPVK